MKKGFLFKSRTAIRSFAIALICTCLLSNAAWGEVFLPDAVVVPPPDLNPLNQTVVPEPPQLAQFVKNKAAAIKLGKAFFWDMQVGSDGIQACATCHFSAGADKRLKNTLNPGAKSGDTAFGNVTSILAWVPGVSGFPQFGPNYTLNPVTDFPFHQRQAPTDVQSSLVTRDTNDVVGSQGVRLSDFAGVVPGSAVDSGLSPVLDPVFNVGGVNLRRVTGRNTPSVINAIFNFTNFWDGRANFLFNGENPFGPSDPNAGVWFNAGGTLQKQAVTIQFASLAAQATGPPLDTTEMSGQGRTFPQLGRKMLSLTPLGKQLVHPGDSVLGPLSAAVLQQNGTVTGSKGLNTTYAQMIRDAFQDNLWNSVQLTPDGFSQMEANFSLYWGLAIQLYEATLVSDQTPFDSWLAGNPDALTDQQKTGFQLFNGIGNCTECHAGTELTTSSAANIAFVNNFINGTIELMTVSDGTQAIYDEGFNNTAVTPTLDDLGRGGTAPFNNPLNGNLPFPLAFTSLAILQAQNPSKLPFETPILDPFIPIDIPDNKNGLFKAPGLRNVELTAPYFHNGSVMTLEEVVDIYVRGGNFPAANITDLDPVVGAGLPLMQGNATMRAALVAFLKSLTDPRVVNESAPFDHPELLIPEGDPEVLTRLPARDATGSAAVAGFSLNAVTTPTNVPTQTITGTVEAGATVQVTVNGGAPISATVTGIDWSAITSGLTEGANTIDVTAVVGGVQTTVTANITLDTAPPALAMNAVTSPTNVATQSISGTVEAGATVQVSVNGGAPSLATVTASSWNYNVNLIEGPNTISVTAADAAGNTATLPPATITLVLTTTVTVDRSTYGRAAQGRVDVWAAAAVGSALDVTGGPNLPLTPAPMVGDGTGKFFVRIAVADPATLPASITVTLNRGLPSQAQVSSPLIDVVTITKAEHNLSTGVLTIQASSSDTLTPPNGPTLTAEGLGTLASGGLIVTGFTNPLPSVTVTSSKGGSFTMPVSLVEVVNAPPTITSTPVTTASLGQSYSYDVNATDPNGDTLTYSLTTAPGGMTINATTGVIGWTPATAGSYNVTVRVQDPGGLFVTQSFTITITIAQPDTVTVTRAQFTLSKNEWRVEGTSLPAPTQPRTVTVYLGPTVGGTFIGTTNVAADGRWSFIQANSQVAPPSTLNQKISVQSSGGGKLENITLFIVR